MAALDRKALSLLVVTKLDIWYIIVSIKLIVHISFILM